MAIFGHSMGALIAYEVACRLNRGSLRAPTHLFVSGQRAPHLESDGELSYLSPAPQFLDKVKRLNGTASAVFEHPELVDFLLPILRADFAVAETYTYRQSEPLNCPLTVFGGLADDVPEFELAGWRYCNRGRFRLQMFPGDHFFLLEAKKQLLNAMVGDLRLLDPRLPPR